MAKTTYDRVSEIQMLVQIAERYLHHNQSNEQLKLTLSLVTIARGSCSMVIRPNGKHGITPFGKLHIPKDRAVMSAEASISESDFASFSDKLCHPAPRPITAIINLIKHY